MAQIAAMIDGKEFQQLANLGLAHVDRGHQA
eukprot:CAMPEP_0172653972 /NCGR_PEP_ID=MMETSP1068-20121228/244099_1 /TAXON_ID=35684 /ORGANISM="Pseudopedinella elastica, Strain CCMP716" /LENGTH=30 /DNA_ID= /DNA_START= /DNA_END= /DNA_ORIENTATION=